MRLYKAVLKEVYSNMIIKKQKELHNAAQRLRKQTKPIIRRKEIKIRAQINKKNIREQ